MIADYFYGVLASLLNSFAAHLPTWGLPAADSDQLRDFRQALAAWDAWLPIYPAFRLSLVASALLVALWAFKFVKWVVDKVVGMIP